MQHDHPTARFVARHAVQILNGRRAFSGVASSGANLAAVTEALAATCAIEDLGKRAGAMIELSPGLTGLRFSALHDLWRQILPALARRSRSNLLIDLWASQVFLFALGGSEIMAGVFRGVHAVGEWWPRGIDFAEVDFRHVDRQYDKDEISRALTSAAK